MPEDQPHCPFAKFHSAGLLTPGFITEDGHCSTGRPNQIERCCGASTEWLFYNNEREAIEVVTVLADNYRAGVIGNLLDELDMEAAASLPGVSQDEEGE